MSEKSVKWPWRMVVLLLVAFVLSAVATIGPAKTAEAAESYASGKQAEPGTLLAPVWDPLVRQWAPQIVVLADAYGLDPDFIAAVIKAESNGITDGVSRAGAVGLMGVMPAGPGMEWRPSIEELKNPSTNLRWGVAILAEIIRQSGGDLYAALAAYSGGWEHANSRVPRKYAARVLDYYGRAVVGRNGQSPDIATQWTLAIELRKGHVPKESLLVLGDQPISGLHTYGEHTVYSYVDRSGQAYYVKGFAVPVALVVPPDPDPGSVSFGRGDALEPHLQARLGEVQVKIANSNPRVLIACLPSLSRLRGHVSTRWFAPSDCPSWHR
ncbi:MAG TPA: transglycosylase SLT domain-containing protein [Anaerolineae bacterium]